MRVLSIRALGQPSHNIETLRSVKGNWVAVEEVGDDGIVAVGSKLICHQLAVCPDPNDIWKVENSGILVDGLASGFSNVGVDVTDFDGFTSWLATLKLISIFNLPINLEYF